MLLHLSRNSLLLKLFAQLSGVISITESTKLYSCSIWEVAHVSITHNALGLL
jgi:hypothetical protein